MFGYPFCVAAKLSCFQIKKEAISLEEKDEFDALVESNAKPLDDRLGNSPEKMEKKTGKKGQC